MDQKDESFLKLNELLNSKEISKFQKLVQLLNGNFGDKLYRDLKNNDQSVLNYIRNLGVISPRETIYIFNQIYNYISKLEFDKNERVNLATLYFWIGDIIYNLGRDGYGSYFLKAYVEDLAFHDKPLEGGAAHALSVYCFLGESGTKTINKEIAKKLEVEESRLGEELKKITRKDFESLIISLENNLSLENNEDFLLPISSILKFIEEIEPLVTKGKKNKERFRLLENLCQLLFGSVKGFRYKLDERSQLFQIDGTIINASKHSFLTELGKNIIVEAKQYFHRRAIHRNIIDIIAMNMSRFNATSAFLVSSGYLTSTGSKEIYHNYIRTGNFIIFLNLSDLKRICNQEISFPVLISQKISTIKSYRKVV